jgi:hypothetical protein
MVLLRQLTFFCRRTPLTLIRGGAWSGLQAQPLPEKNEEHATLYTPCQSDFCAEVLVFDSAW